MRKLYIMFAVFMLPILACKKSVEPIAEPKEPVINYKDKFVKRIFNNYRKIDFKYNSNNQLTEIADGYLNSPVILSQRFFTYDELNRLDTMYLKLKDNSYINGYRFVYKGNTNIVDTVHIFSDNNGEVQTGFHIIQFQYGQNGRVVAMNKMQEVRRHYLLIQKHSFGYNNRGNVLEYYVENWDCITNSLIDRKNFTYKYDNKASWIKPLNLPSFVYYLPVQSGSFVDIINSANNYIEFTTQNTETSPVYKREFSYVYDADGYPKKMIEPTSSGMFEYFFTY